MQILLYEFVTGGGWYSVEEYGQLSPTLAAEGAAMLASVAADLSAVPGVELTVLRDKRRRDLHLPNCRVLEIGSACAEFDAISSAAESAAWSMVIAPEFDQLLHSRCRWVLEASGRLLGPGLELVALASDKHVTAEWLRAAGVAAPRGLALPANEPLPFDFNYPAVWKPRFGAGSQGVRVVKDAAQAEPDVFLPRETGRLEEFCPGLAASVVCLCGPAGIFPLPPCRQHLSDEESFAYLGGSLPLPRELAARAKRLAEQTVTALPAPLGYLGVDLVLGHSADGSEDYVIEVNPRCTTSYVGLRAAAECNVMAALLDIAAGRTPRLAFRDEPIQFTTAGAVRR